MESTLYVKTEPNMTSYMRRFTREEREALAKVQEQMQIEVTLQQIAGREHYGAMLHLEPGTNAFQREAKRVLKKVA
ncbi:MAG: hypothetical protein AABX39_05685 [Nanoarchaeota archaeon]